MVTVTKQEADALLMWRRHPTIFMEQVLGAGLYDKQLEMVNAVRDYRRVAVSGCNGSGKDYTSGRIMLWWQMTHFPAKSIVIGPTHRQVAEIVWREARSAYNRVGGALGGKFLETASWSHDPDHFALGFATTDEMNIQGFHSPNLLLILTEAHNLEQEQIDAVKRLGPTRLLLTGNPLVSGGEFYAAFHELADMYHTIEISAFETPNVMSSREDIPGLVTLEQVEERKREWGKESALYIASVLGKFPDNLTDGVVPRSKLLEACERTIEVEEHTPKTLACDVARYGDDATVVYERQGPRCSLKWKAQGKNTQEVAGQLIAFVQDDADVDTLVVDETGLGAGVVDRLREEKLPRRVRVIGFNGGASAMRKDRYANLITEAWMELAAAFKEDRIDLVQSGYGLAANPHTALISQLSSRKFTIQGDRRMKLESKDDYKKRNRGSPDEADALAMTEIVGAMSGVGVRFLG